jgi:DNA-binding transcriptional ArsR family regulator
MEIVRRKMEKLLVLAQAIACPTRLAMLRALGEKGCTLTAAAHLIGVSPSTAFHHLDRLVHAGLVTRTIRGRESIYKWGRARWQLVRMPPPSPPAPTMPDGEPS